MLGMGVLHGLWQCWEVKWLEMQENCHIQALTVLIKKGESCNIYWVSDFKIVHTWFANTLFPLRFSFTQL